METPKSAFRSSTGEQSRRRIDFGSKQLSEDSGLCIDSPWASSTPDCGVRKGSAVVASPKCYRRQERRSCFDWCYFLLWFCGIVAVIVLVGILTAISWKKFPEVPAVAMLKQNVISGVICVAGFIIFAGLVGMLGTHRLSNRAEESLMEFMHEDMDSAGQELKKKRSDTMNVHILSPGNVEYRGPEEEEGEDSCSQKKDNESENTTSLLAGQKLGVHDYPVNRVDRKATWNTWSVSILCTFVCFLMLNSRGLEEYRRLPRNMVRGLVQNHQRLESYGSPTSTVANVYVYENVKEDDLAETIVSKRQPNESFGDVGQSLKDSYRDCGLDNVDAMQEDCTGIKGGRYGLFAKRTLFQDVINPKIWPERKKGAVIKKKRFLV